ncbi:MAG: hypothetical protein U0414_24810 [Polyangiaceae bacterium]
MSSSRFSPSRPSFGSARRAAASSTSAGRARRRWWVGGAARFAALAGLALGVSAGASCKLEPLPGPPPPPAPLDIPDDPDCDPLVPEVCGMPFPSSRWLAEDGSTKTGYRLAFGPTTLPANDKGVHIDPAPYRRLDGFGVGVPAVVFFEGLDGSNLPDETRIAETMAPASPVAMFAVKNGALERIPCFAELDSAAESDDQRALIIRPAVLLEEGTRYVVALRGLKKKDGAAVKPSDAFVALRDKRALGTPVADRAARFEEIFTMLGAAGIERSELVLAWDWVTASADTLHGPLLHMRDESFAALGDASPKITVDGLQTFTEAESADIAYEVSGTIDVPDYTVPTVVSDTPAWVLNWDGDGPAARPQASGVYKAPFLARVPRSALDGTPHGILLHGHGLNGSRDQIRNDVFDHLAETEHVVVVGCDMIGMSHEDVNGILAILNDLSGFPIVGDRLHQGVLDHAFLARAMKKGFDKVPEIAATGVVIDPSSLYYFGISQGGIFGATHLAMSLDITRGHLGVPGNDYSTLLQRSNDFGVFFTVMSLFYPDHRDQQIALGAIQCLWDRTDPVSHYRHISEDPFPGTPSHAVLLAQAKGDWQVAPLTNEITARSGVGVALMTSYGRDVALVTPTPYPHVGSGLVSYDFGNAWAPPGNAPPMDAVEDPHGKPRKEPNHNAQMFHFFRTGEIIDVCGGDACTPD